MASRSRISYVALLSSGVKGTVDFGQDLVGLERDLAVRSGLRNDEELFHRKFPVALRGRDLHLRAERYQRRTEMKMH